MASFISKARKGLSAGKKAARTATTIWLRQRHHYGWHYKYSKVEDDVILFESFHGKSMSDSPLHMLRAFMQDPRSKGFRIYYATTYENLAVHRQLAESLGLDGIEFATIGSWRYARLLATAKYLVNNSSFPAYFIRRPEQHYLQTWHGTPLKTLGKEMRLGVESMYNVQHNFLQADTITFPNEFTRDVLMRDYNLEDLYTGKTALVGYPRNQVFFDQGKADQIRERYGLRGVETFAYMPTWRGTNNYTVDVGNYRSQVKRFLKKIDAVLRDDQMMFYNFHTMVAAKMGDFSFKHIFPFPEDADNYEFLNAMDVLVTDYSSVFFDYSLTRRPVILFAYDEEQYLQERGMYLSIDDLPFPKVRSIGELAKMIRTGAYRDIDYDDSRYTRDFLAYDSPNNAQACMSLLFGEQPEGVKVTDHAANKERPWRTVAPCRQEKLADIRTACEGTDPERDIIVFSRKRFDEDKSKLLYDNYRHDRNFIFKTNAYACTAIEEILRRRPGRVRAEVDRREMLRVLPGLDVPNKPVASVYAGALGSSFMYSGQTPPSAAAVIRETPDGLQLTFDKAPFNLEGVALTQLRKITARGELDADERGSATVGPALQELLNAKAASDDDAYVVVDGTDRKTGAKKALAVKSSVDVPLFDDDKTAGLFAHVRNGSVVTAAYVGENGLLRVTNAKRGTFLSKFKYAILDSVSTAGKRDVRIRLRLRDGQFIVEDFILRQRASSPTNELHLPYTLTACDGWLYLECTFNPNDYPFREIYWDAYVVLRYFGLPERIPVRMSVAQIMALKLGNQQWRIGADKVLFTHIMKYHSLSFIYRDYYPELDTYRLRVKEVAALGTFALLYPYWKRKRMWLVYEKFCSLAQDNGFYFFEYCMGLPENKRDHIFYVIDKGKPDYANVQPYDAQVLDFMSFKHILYTMVADLYVASDSKSHLYVWRNKPSLVRNMIARHKIFFLQHGVTALKQDANLFGRRGSSPMTYYLTTSQNEQDIIVKNFGYRMNRVPVLGFSRWDALEDTSTPERPSILLMPTWRLWLEEQSDDVFVQSDYFRAYSALIYGDEMAEFLEKHDATLKFFIHPKLSGQLKNFARGQMSSRVQLIEQGSRPLNELIMECSALITDYSSVCWDVLYMSKPVVFYQFDQELYEKAIGSYVDLNADLPGAVAFDEPQVASALEACAQRGFTLSEEEAAKTEGWFAHHDKLNRQRTYNFIIDKGF